MLTKRQKFYLPFKRLIDIFGSLFGIAVLSPILVFCTIMSVLTSKGPVLFKQIRLGRNKKPFMLYKFRSMRIDAPQIPPEQMTLQQQQDLVTPWGKFIRKTSLDEIPQLFNIFLGDMSFIGPRPSQDQEHEMDLINVRDSYIPSPYIVKPGLSGYAQIHMKRNHDIYEKAKEDSYYVQHFGFWLDFKLFVYSFFLAVGFVRGR
jgi:lipopolysaccharide/colanic/teichoic acid biosynthesis glycosyltransferase